LGDDPERVVRLRPPLYRHLRHGGRGQLIKYLSIGAYNYNAFTAYVGPSFRGRDYQATVNFNASTAQLGGALYSQSIGVAPTVLVPLSDRVVFNQSVSYTDTRYHTEPGENGNSVGLGSSLQWFFDGPGAFIQPKVTFGAQWAHTDTLANHYVSTGVGYYQPIGWGFSLYLEPSLKSTLYNGYDYLTDTTRHDTTYSMTANVSYDLGLYGSQLALGFVRTFNASNQHLYKYERDQVTLSAMLPL
jgi:hypothetical protein